MEDVALPHFVKHRPRRFCRRVLEERKGNIERRFVGERMVRIFTDIVPMHSKSIGKICCLLVPFWIVAVVNIQSIPAVCKISKTLSDFSSLNNIVS
jgi:hypothetical protein